MVAALRVLERKKQYLGLSFCLYMEMKRRRRRKKKGKSLRRYRACTRPFRYFSSRILFSFLERARTSIHAPLIFVRVWCCVGTMNR